MAGRHYPTPPPAGPKIPTVKDYAYQAGSGDGEAAWDLCLRCQPTCVSELVALISPMSTPTPGGFDAVSDAFEWWVVKGRPTA